MKIVVSTTTSTGMGELKKRLPSHIQKIYYPIDRAAYVRRALMTIHPEAIVLVEAEIWPNFLWMAGELGIPTFLVNARLSERSFQGYKRWGLLFRKAFAAFSGVGCQNEADAARLRELGCRPEVVRVVGSMKYDTATIAERHVVDVPRLLEQLGVPADAPVVVGGSTHPGEEGVLAQAFLRLRQRFPKLFLVVVPRHFERGREAGKEIADHGLRFAYRKDVTPNTRYEAGQLDCLLVNTTGELRYFYEHAQVIFVGKSLTAQGGQNPIEPAALAKPIVFGPHMQNFAAIAASFLAKGGAAQVHNADELADEIGRILADPNRASQMGQAALAVVRENLGAMERTVDMIVECLDGTEIFVAPA